MTQQRERGNEWGFLFIPKQTWSEPSFPSICSRAEEKIHLCKQRMCCLLSINPHRKGKKKKAYTFSNLSQFILTIVAEQVNTGEPGYPVRPATRGGFQHFIPQPGNTQCHSLAAVSAHTERITHSSDHFETIT